MPFTRRTKLVLGVVSVAALLVASVAVVAQRIPSGHVGVASPRVLQAGWTLHAPFFPVPTIVSSGSLALADIALTTTEGSALGFRLDLRYTVAEALAPQLVLDIRRDGFDEAVAGLARRVLADTAQHTDIESLLSDPARVEDPLRTALRAAGITPESLSLRSTIGDELIRRRRTEEALALAREPIGRVLVIG